MTPDNEVLNENRVVIEHTTDHTLVLEPRGAKADESVAITEQGTAGDSKGRSHALTDTLLAGTISMLVTGAIVGVSYYSYQSHKETTSQAPILVQAFEPTKEPAAPNPYSNLEVEATAYVVYDTSLDMVLVAKRADEVRPLASLVKLMTGLVPRELTSPDTRIAISPASIQVEGDSGLFANETWTVDLLNKFVLVTSSNDGADAVASALGALGSDTSNTTPEYVGTDPFVREMNAKAQALDLPSLSFRNPTGLDDGPGAYGGTGNATDVAKLLQYMWHQHPDLLLDTTLPSTVYVSEDGFIHEAKNTNQYVTSVPGLLGSKTGFTEYAGGNLAILYDAGLHHPIAVVVLGSTPDGRFKDVATLVRATQEYMNSGWYEYHTAGSTPTSS